MFTFDFVVNVQDRARDLNVVILRDDHGDQIAEVCLMDSADAAQRFSETLNMVANQWAHRMEEPRG